MTSTSLSRCCHGVTVNLVASKCRLVPSKSQTSPRLELLSCLLLSKLLVSVLDVISQVVTVSSIFCCSGSMVALWWIKQDEKRWNIWVQNRVNVIRVNSSPDIWFHISPSSNPADISACSISLAHLDLLLQFHVPQFLLDYLKNWSPKDVTLPFGEINLEERSVNIVVAAVSSVEREALGKVIDCRRYGSLNKLSRVTGYVLRFKTNILAKLRNKLSDFKIGELTVTETEEYKTLWFLHDQKFIIGKDNFTKVKNSLYLLYDGKKILRVKTRISGMESFSFDKKFLILLKKNSYFRELIVLNAHAAVFRSGVHSTLNYIHSNYWIVKGRQTIKQLLKRCFIYKYV